MAKGEVQTEQEIDVTNVEELKVAAEEFVDAEQEVSVEQAQAERIAELEDGIKRYAADLDNLRKRGAKEMVDARKFAAAGFAKEMIDVLDNLGRALENAAEGDALRDGVQMTYDGLLAAFERQGIVQIEPLGEVFDHNKHQAIARKATDDCAPNTVTAVIQAGYVLHERLLRPAIVEVSVASVASVVAEG